MRFKVPDSPVSSPEPSPPSSPVLSPLLSTGRRGERSKSLPGVPQSLRRSSDTSVLSNEDSHFAAGASSSTYKHRRTPTMSAASPKESSWECREFYTALKLRQRGDPTEENEERERRLAMREAKEESERNWKPISDLLNLGGSSIPSERLHSSYPSSLSPPTADFFRTPTLDQRVQAAWDAQLREVQHILGNLELRQADARIRRAEMDARRKKELWDSINRTIQLEEAAARKIAEEKAAAKRAEEARLRKIEEERQRKLKEAEEAKRHAEEAEAERKAKAEAEERRKEEEEKQRQEKAVAEEKQKQEREAAEKEAEKAQGFAPKTAKQELQLYWDRLQTLKNDVMPTVRAKKGDSSMVNPEWKKIYSATRRSFTPKIGQVTNSLSEITRIARLIHESLTPNPPHPPKLYLALLSALAKAFLLQAETEVTAKPNTAFPLARLVLKILEFGHAPFADVFMARLLGRSGAWALATTMPRLDGQSDDAYRKMLGYADEETSELYIGRVIGMLTLYFAILQAPLTASTAQAAFSFGAPPPPPANLSSTIPSVFQFHRTWTWLARACDNPHLMSHRAAPQIMYAVVETVGDRMMAVYGKQMIKWRKTVAAKSMDEGPGGEAVGGAEGKAARVRLGLMFQKWEKDGLIGGQGREIGR